MRRLEEHAIHRLGMPAFVLMDHAAKAVAQEARRLLGRKRGPVVVVAGGGHNGGDGVAAARWLKGWGHPAQVLWLKNPAEWKGSAALHYAIARRSGVRFRAFPPHARAARPALVIDALLGTGTQGELRVPYRAAIDWINQLRGPVVSVDIPSGLDADRGQPLGAAVQATVTVTMAVAKKGLLVPAARPFVGRLVVADIGIPS